MAGYVKSPLVRRMGQKAMRGVVRRYCAKVDCVITPSRHTRDALRADGVQARFAVVPSGVIGPNIRPNAREETRACIGLAPDAPLLLCVGRLGPEKRVDLLLQAVVALQKRDLPAPLSRFRLALVGDGQARQELEGMADELGIRERVLFLGAQPHATIGDWYAAADLFTLSSPAETQGLVLVEAMAAGLPCVAVNHGGPREVVVQGKTGLRVPFNAGVFAQTITTLLRDPEMRRQMGENGRQRAREVYSPEAMAQGVLAVYETVRDLPRLPPTPENGMRKFTRELKRRREKLLR
jgi:glycosyltransferase involved in cell wall biosynthesis